METSAAAAAKEESEEESEESEEDERPKKKLKKKKVQETTPEPGMSKEMNEKVCVLYVKTKKNSRMDIDISPLQNNRKNNTMQKFGLKLKKPVIVHPAIVAIFPVDNSILWLNEYDLDNILNVVNRSSMAKVGFISSGGSIEGDYENDWTVILVPPSIEQVLKSLLDFFKSSKYSDSKLTQWSLNRSSPLPLQLEEGDIVIYQSSYKIPVNEKYSVIIPFDEFEQYRADVGHRRLNRAYNSNIMLEMNADLVLAECMIQKSTPMSTEIVYCDEEKFKKRIKELKTKFTNFRGKRGLGSTDTMK